MSMQFEQDTIINGINMTKIVPKLWDYMKSNREKLSGSAVLSGSQVIYAERYDNVYVELCQRIYAPGSKRIDVPCRCDFTAVNTIEIVKKRAHANNILKDKLEKPDIRKLEYCVMKYHGRGLPYEIYRKHSEYCFKPGGPVINIKELLDWMQIFPDADIFEVERQSPENNPLPQPQGICLKDNYGNFALIATLPYNNQKPTDLDIEIGDDVS